ncbi:MAG: hypothetical protein JWQ88_3531, partial [Rhodoferax sp.]|nr:hypothetical protein [Rhodoferax sp.]
VGLADHQSLALFMAAFAVLATRAFQPGAGAAAVSGLLAGCAVLLKQNYVIAVALLLLLLVVSGRLGGVRQPVRQVVRVVLYFLLGFSVVLVQIFVTYKFAGILWLYEPAGLARFNVSNMQPVVELVAYSGPKGGSAYLSSLDRPVSAFAYFSTKFYHGVSRFYWAVYLGKPPFDTTPVVLHYTDARLLRFELMFLATVLVASASLFLKSRSMFMLVMTGLAFTCVSTAMGHTEYRYFLFFRLAMLVYAMELGCQLALRAPNARAALARVAATTRLNAAAMRSKRP